MGVCIPYLHVIVPRTFRFYDEYNTIKRFISSFQIVLQQISFRGKNCLEIVRSLYQILWRTVLTYQYELINMTYLLIIKQWSKMKLGCFYFKCKEIKFWRTHSEVVVIRQWITRFILFCLHFKWQVIKF